MLQSSTLPQKCTVAQQCQPGHATTAVSPAATVRPTAGLFATAPRTDPDYDVMVADVPDGTSEPDWLRFAATLPPGSRGIRLVPRDRSVILDESIGRRVAERTGRTVLAPVGAVSPNAGGCLFVGGGPGHGWVRFTPGHEPHWEARRFPRPPWESRTVCEPRRVGPHGMIEPLPAGVWLRPEPGPGAGGAERVNADRVRLIRSVPARNDVLTIVLGGRYLPALAPADIVACWSLLSAADRARVRFVPFGPVAFTADAPVGQALADLLGERIACYAGIPVGNAGTLDVHVLRHDGSHGRSASVRELAYRPNSTPGAPSDDPEVLAHRPLAGLPRTGPATYRYTDDIMVEVVPAGLWLRPPRPPTHAAAVRARQADPITTLVIYEDSPTENVSRMRAAAEAVLVGLGPTLRSAGVTCSATVALAGGTTARSGGAAPTGPSPVQGDLELPWLGALLDPDALRTPGPGSDAESHITKVLSGHDVAALLDSAPARNTEAPRSADRALHSPVALDLTGPVDQAALRAARDWLRANWAEPLARYTEAVAPLLAVTPTLAADQEPDDALCDAAALYHRLAGEEAEGDDAHRPTARCAAAALRTLPTHRGAAVTTLRRLHRSCPTADGRTEFTLADFHPAYTAPSISGEGDIELLLWSLTGRDTMPLTSTGHARIVFAPGTRFTVLSRVPTTPDGRSRILARELSATERSDRGGTPRQSLDQLATNSLLRFADRIAAANQTGESARPRTGNGLLVRTT